MGYDQFQFIKVLFKNRWTVLYCTLLARTENEKEREKIESEMKADPEKAAVLKVCVGKDVVVQNVRHRFSYLTCSRPDSQTLA